MGLSYIGIMEKKRGLEELRLMIAVSWHGGKGHFLPDGSKLLTTKPQNPSNYHQPAQPTKTTVSTYYKLKIGTYRAVYGEYIGIVGKG